MPEPSIEQIERDIQRARFKEGETEKFLTRRAARKAHIPAVAVTWGLNSEASLAAEHPRFLVHSPSELLEILDNH